MQFWLVYYSTCVISNLTNPEIVEGYKSQHVDTCCRRKFGVPELIWCSSDLYFHSSHVKLTSTYPLTPAFSTLRGTAEKSRHAVKIYSARHHYQGWPPHPIAGKSRPLIERAQFPRALSTGLIVQVFDMGYRSPREFMPGFYWRTFLYSFLPGYVFFPTTSRR